MNYNHKIKTSDALQHADLIGKHGVHSIKILRDLAQSPKTPQSIKHDWSVIEEWLGCAGRQLNQNDFDKISKAWIAYYAIGVAPSHQLQSLFDDFSEKYSAERNGFLLEKAPTHVMDVFDRMLATDAQINEKKAADWAVEKDKFAKILSNLPSKNQTSWWRQQSRSFRAWIFISFAWAAIATFYISVFDPFDVRNWNYADVKDYLKAFSTIGLIFILGIFKKMYDLIVK